MSLQPDSDTESLRLSDRAARRHVMRVYDDARLGPSRFSLSGEVCVLEFLELVKTCPVFSAFPSISEGKVATGTLVGILGQKSNFTCFALRLSPLISVGLKTQTLSVLELQPR